MRPGELGIAGRREGVCFVSFARSIDFPIDFPTETEMVHQTRAPRPNVVFFIVNTYGNGWK